MRISVVFPHQLYADVSPLQSSAEVVLVEDHLFFLQYPFHQQKLLLHRASMRYYQQYLAQQGLRARYVPLAEADLATLFAQWRQQGVTEVHYIDTTDYLLERRLQRHASRNKLPLLRSESPNFLNTTAELRGYAGEKKLLMAHFYTRQRKLRQVLVENGEPVGGKWSFDDENRKRIPKGLVLPNTYAPTNHAFVAEARAYVTRHFAKNPGNTDTFSYATTHEEAAETLEHFLHHRLHHFGAYEDAILQNESVLFHSVLTPALNIGLLSPGQIVSRTLDFARQHRVPLNSLEGFIRQVMGWREFMRMVYLHRGVPLRTQPYFGFTRKIPGSFYNASTGITPIDRTIHKVLQTGYCHHIERLMVLGNFMLLCEFDPHEVYRWFMELFIDAYDWVMVPNVYGMSQYADGGLMTTKPYVSGSNYILKMSDYTKGPWCEIWDALYWRFIWNNREAFGRNPRMSMVVNLVQKMDAQKRERHLATANHYLQSL
jgi:deoxyribodipyrimidine photolyase-related protein